MPSVLSTSPKKSVDALVESRPPGEVRAGGSLPVSPEAKPESESPTSGLSSFSHSLLFFSAAHPTLPTFLTVFSFQSVCRDPQTFSRFIHRPGRLSRRFPHPCHMNSLRTTARCHRAEYRALYLSRSKMWMTTCSERMQGKTRLEVWISTMPSSISIE